MKRRMAAMAAMTVAGVVLLGAGSLWAQTAGVLHGCANQARGQLRLVRDGEGCGPEERTVSWNVQGPAGQQGVQGPQGPAGPGGGGGLVVVDANDKVVGPYLNGLVPVYLEGRWFTVGVRPSGFSRIDPAHYFTQTNCSGEPLIYNSGADTFFAGPLMFVSDSVAEYPADETVTQPILSYSYLRSDSGERVCQNGTPGGTFSPVRTTNPSTLGFVAPFRLMGLSSTR